MHREQTNTQTFFFIYIDYHVKCNKFIRELLFDGQLSTINTVSIEINFGLVLSKALICHENFRNINFFLQTIDDLYVLLDGLVPNVQTMTIQLYQSRLLSK